MKQILLVAALITLCASLASAESGMISVKSTHSVKTTTDRLEVALRAKGMTVFIRIDHAEGAHKVGKELRPTELIIFGNPKIGTTLMQCSQSIAIDLPQKALVWEDQEGNVWLAYNDPEYLASRHNINNCGEAIAKIKKALHNFAQTATMPQMENVSKDQPGKK